MFLLSSFSSLKEVEGTGSRDFLQFLNQQLFLAALGMLGQISNLKIRKEPGEYKIGEDKSRDTVSEETAERDDHSLLFQGPLFMLKARAEHGLKPKIFG
jgi:hypothetical protein